MSIQFGHGNVIESLDRIVKLVDWRREVGMTQQQLADELGCILTTVARYETGRRKPDEATMLAIYTVTNGRVQPNDFYDLPPLPRQRVA